MKCKYGHRQIEHKYIANSGYYGPCMECFDVIGIGACTSFRLEKEAIDMREENPTSVVKYIVIASGYKGSEQFMMLDGFRIAYDKETATKKAESLAASENFKDYKVYVAELRTVSKVMKPVVTTNLV